MKFKHILIIGMCLLALMLMGCSTNDFSKFGDDALVCFKAEGAGVFTFFSGYAETRVVHVPKALQASMGIENLETITERCWLESSGLQMIEALRLIDQGQATNLPPL